MKIRYYIFILLILVLGSTKTMAQSTATATMRISATIVSGATLEGVNAIEFDFLTNSKTKGLLEFKISKNIDTHIESSSEATLMNQNGDFFSADLSEMHHKIGNKNLIEFNTDFNDIDSETLEGTYTGEIVTTINYL